MTPHPLYILNGPNLNLLGLREPDIYGPHTLKKIKKACELQAERFGLKLVFRQTNHEGELIDWVQEAAGESSALLLNPAGYGHTSLALYDALKLVDKPIIEIHLSLPQSREAFRGVSYVSRVATGVISGFGLNSYVLGTEAAARILSLEEKDKKQEGESFL